MKANLYISNSSLNYDGVSTSGQISQKLKDLHIAIQEIREDIYKHKIDEDQISTYEGIYEIKIYEGLTFYDFLSNNFPQNCALEVSRDVRIALKRMIDKAKYSNLTETDVLQHIKDNNLNSLNGLICLNSIQVQDDCKYTMISSKDDWYYFHRSFLTHTYIDENYFYCEIINYFPQIYFHPRIEASLKGIDGRFENFVKSIIYNLTQLNDKFKLYPIQSNLRDTLKKFSIECSVHATLEGNIRRKNDFTFSFVDAKSSKIFQVCCEPHLKLDKNDLPGNAHFYFNRIYFHPGLPEVNDGKILVGHIGSHL